MIISCEKCYATYVVSLASLGQEGRMVKCAKCSFVWYAKPSSEEVNLISSSENNNFDQYLKSSLPVLQGPHVTLIHKIMPLILVIAIMFTGLIMYSEKFSKISFLANIYEKFKISDSKDIVFDNLIFQKINNVKNFDLAVQGDIINNSNQVKKIPLVKFTIYDEHRRELFSHILNLENKYLNPNEHYKLDNKLKNLSGNEKYLLLEMGNKLELLTRSGL